MGFLRPKNTVSYHTTMVTPAISAGTPPQMGLALGKLIADNARERRNRYRALKEEGRAGETSVWPSTDQSASAAPANGVPPNSTNATQKEDSHSAQRTAHLLLRVLGLTFVAPLMEFGKQGDPANLVRNGVSPMAALDTMESMIAEQPATLNHEFASTPDSHGLAAGESSTFTSTTLDLWLCPRMLVAAAVLTLRSCEAMSTAVDAESSSTASSRQAAFQLRESLLRKLKVILKLSLRKANHLQSIRTLLGEMITSSVRALALTGLDPPACLQRDLSVETAEGDSDDESASQPFISFFQNGLEASHALSAPAPASKPSGEGIARLWMPEDHTCFSIYFKRRRRNRHLLRSLAQAMLCLGVDVVLSLADEHPMTLLDLGQTALQAFLADWQRDLHFRHGPTLPRGSPDVVRAARLEVAERIFSATSGKLWQPEAISIPVIAELLSNLHDDDDDEVDQSVSEVDSWTKLSAALRALRQGTVGCAKEPWAQLKRNASELISVIIEETQPEEVVPRTGVERRRCALEGIVIILRFTPTPCPLNPFQTRELLTYFESHGSVAANGACDERAGSAEGTTSRTWLSESDLAEVCSLLQGRHLGPRNERKRTVDSQAASPVTQEALLARYKADGVAMWTGDYGPHVCSTQIHSTGFRICAAAGQLQEVDTGRGPDSAPTLSCSACDNLEGAIDGLELQRGSSPSVPGITTARKASALSPTHLVHCLDYVRRCARHAPYEDFTSTSQSTAHFMHLGFTHANREVRLAAGRLAFTIAAKHCTHTDASALGLKTRLSSLFATHQALLADSSPKFQEAAIISLGRLGRINREEILEQVLLQLTLQLNGRILLRSCAYLQITQLAAHYRCSVYALLSPHFAAISPPVVERMTSAPNLFIEVLNLTNQNQAKFLQATIPFTLPAIIASRNAKVLELIVGALGTNTAKLCLEQAPAILKHYLLLPAGQRDRNIQTYLDTIRKESAQEVPLKGLYRSYIGEILGHLVACLGDAQRRPMAVDGLRHIEGVLSADKADRSRSKTVSGGDLSVFLREEILGILAWLNDDLMSVNGKKTPSFKAMVARSIGVFIEVIGSSISIVAPQIMATLSSTLQVTELRLATLDSWRIFMTTLRFDDVGPFIGQSVAALLSQWSDFTKAEKTVAKDILSYLIVENAQEMQKHINEIPNMDDLTAELPEVCRKLRSSRQSWSPEQQLAQILDRVADENVSISLRSLRELKAFIVQHRDYVAEQASGTAFAPIAATMISALLSSIRRSDDTQEEAQDLSLQCLGMLGAIDPDRLNMVSEDNPHKLLQNFQDRDETIDFVVHLVRDILVSAFRATSDTKHQSALAYAIQELLKFSGFTSVLLRPGGRSMPLKVKQRWNDLPPAVIDTIAPLLDSKYSITHGPATDYPKPFYHHSSSYREWIEIWANHLMQGATGQDAETIFGIFRVLIRHHDLDVTQHILPHAVLHNLISGDDARREELRQEFVAVLTDQVDPKMGYSPDRRLLCAQTVFSLMDHMSAWLRLKRMQQSKQQGRQRREPQHDESLANVESVIASISQELMARASLYCRAYARSLLNFEKRIRDLKGSGKSNHDLQSYYENLHMIYASLDEPDGMEGISTCIISPSLEHQIREHESTGRWTSAQSCWEVQIQSSPDEPANHVGLLQCLRNLGHYDTMRTHVRGALALNPQWENILAPFAIEGACILGDWQEAQDAIKRQGTDGSSEHAIAKVLLSVAGKSQEPFDEVLKSARHSLGKPILTAGRNSYSQIYESVLHLHMLHEVALIRNLSTKSSRAAGKVSELMDVLNTRLNSTLPSFRVREPLLSMRRSAFSAQREAEGATESLYQGQIAEAWISTCKTARKAGFTQTAYSAVLQSMVHQAPFAFVQRAKLLSSGDQLYSALQELRNAIQSLSTVMQLAVTGATTTNNESSVIDLSSDVEVDRLALSRAMILQARLYESTARYGKNEVIEAYRVAARMDNKSEKAWYSLGRYYDQIRHSMISPGNATAQDHNVCRYFIKSAQLGTKFFYRSVPRMLTIWLDLGDDPLLVKMAIKNTVDRNSKPEEWEKVDTYARMNDLVVRATARLQPYQWLAVFPQLVSRIVHKNERVWEILKDVIVLVVKAYPHQAMWGMVAGFQSTDASRKRRANAIVEAAKSGKTSKEVVKIIELSQQLAFHLLRLCEQNVGKTVTTLAMESAFPELPALARGDLILPLQASVTVNLPANHELKADHSPFPSELPRLTGFESTIEIMNSLQRPRKIVMIGSDGKRYAFLCKPKDDLRKDARLMEFDSMINKLLQSNSESRRRHLLIRTYAVVTLNEECGLIEWVPNTIGLRHILARLYQARGIPLYTQDIRGITDECRKLPEGKAAELFETKVLSRYPPVFHEWFLNTFPEPAAWLRARLSYSRTAAVMSMVGYVLGLGDRHGENMLFDSVSGDTVHVDFNCLFEKGLTFEIPEVVPFRLTRNMTDAMGVTGCEGVFRRAAEITMAILRSNKDSLMSVLEAMIHDPLVEWGPDDRHRSKSSSSSRSDPRVAHARASLDPVASKLDGRQRISNSRSYMPPTSTNALVDALIRDATSNGKLSQLYIGWCAWA